MRRRDFIAHAARGALSATLLGGLVGCGGKASGVGTRRGRMSPTERWGLPKSGQEGLLPPSARPEGIYELFMLGGVSPWETFYTVPEHGNPAAGGPYAGQQWWTFQDRGPVTVPELMHQRCGYAGVQPYEGFRSDAAGMVVNLGPFVMPLRHRPDILKRMRVWVMRHDLQPHDAAIPYAITGNRLGVPKLASLGTHIQRYYQDARQAAPSSYAMIHSSLAGNRADAAWATGLHRPTARPLVIRLGPSSRLAGQLQRLNVAAYRDDLDALVAHYTVRFQELRATDPQGVALRSPGLADFDYARHVLANHADLAGLITEDLLQLVEASACKGDPTLDETTTSIRLGAHLMTSPVTPARYVQVVDGGIYPDPAGMGYDSHPEHVFTQGSNILHALKGLTSVINEPGEDDPRKLDLDRHFVLINTEFGRTPYPERTKTNPDGWGSNHWPWGYVVVGFGGFCDEDRSGVVGVIGEDGLAQGGFTPAEHRAAMLLAMGIWPFNEEGFAVSDVGSASSETEAAIRLREELLGYPS